LASSLVIIRNGDDREAAKSKSGDETHICVGGDDVVRKRNDTLPGSLAASSIIPPERANDLQASASALPPLVTDPLMDLVGVLDVPFIHLPWGGVMGREGAGGGRRLR